MNAAIMLALLAATPAEPIAPVSSKEELAALEQKLVGAWMGHGPCVGNSVFQSDGTYHRSGYGPGGGHFETGTWKIDWSELPPILELKPSPTEADDSEEPLKVYIVRLNDKRLDFRWSGNSDSRIEEHRRGTEMNDVAIRINIFWIVPFNATSGTTNTGQALTSRPILRPSWTQRL